MHGIGSSLKSNGEDSDLPEFLRVQKRLRHVVTPEARIKEELYERIGVQQAPNDPDHRVRVTTASVNVKG